MHVIVLGFVGETAAGRSVLRATWWVAGMLSSTSPIGRLAETLHVLDDCGFWPFLMTSPSKEGAFTPLPRNRQHRLNFRSYKCTTEYRVLCTCTMYYSYTVVADRLPSTVRSPTAAIASEPPIAALYVVNIVLSRRRRRCL